MEAHDINGDGKLSASEILTLHTHTEVLLPPSPPLPAPRTFHQPPLDHPRPRLPALSNTPLAPAAAHAPHPYLQAEATLHPLFPSPPSSPSLQALLRLPVVLTPPPPPPPTTSPCRLRPPSASTTPTRTASSPPRSSARSRWFCPHPPSPPNTQTQPTSSFPQIVLGPCAHPSHPPSLPSRARRSPTRRWRRGFRGTIATTTARSRCATWPRSTTRPTRAPPSTRTTPTTTVRRAWGVETPGAPRPRRLLSR